MFLFIYYTWLLICISYYINQQEKQWEAKLPNSVKLCSGWGYYAVQGNSRSPNLVPIESSYANFLLVINSNLYLAPFPRYSLRQIQNRYIWLPLLHLTPPPPTEGFPCDDLRKIFRRCQWMAKVTCGIETLPKISVAWVGCTNVTDDRQTDGQRHSEHEPTFTKTGLRLSVCQCISCICISYYIKQQEKQWEAKLIITKNAVSIISLQYSDDTLGRLTNSSATCCWVEETYWEASCQLRQSAAGYECHGNQLNVFTVGQWHIITWDRVVDATDGS